METVIPIQKVVDALLNADKPVPPRYLYRLSDLADEDLAAVEEVWPRVPAWRRQALLEDLQILSNSDDVIWFMEIGRLGLSDDEPSVRVNALRLIDDYEPTELAEEILYLLEQDSETEVRAAAASALGPLVYLGEIEEMHEEDLHTIEEALLRAATGKDAELVRRRALEALGYSSRPEVDPLIERAYNSGKSDWMITALFAMGRSSDNQWAGPVIDSLTHTRPQVRAEAASAAGELGLSDAAPTLIDLLGDDDSDVRDAAIWSLSQIGGEGVAEALEALLEETEDEEDATFIEEALENLEFTEEFGAFELLDIEGEEFDLDDEDEVEDEDNHNHRKN